MDSFKQPDRRYNPRPLFFWNAKPEKKSLRTILQKCREIGYGGVGILAYDDCGLEYLSEEYFSLYGVVIEEAQRLDMKICLYDEWWFPSGGAGGLLQKRYPDACARRLDMERQPLFHGKTAMVPADGVLMAGIAMEKNTLERVDVTDRCQSGSLRWHCGGEWELLTFHCRADSWGKVNYLDPQAVERFIEITHEEYYRRFASYFGTVIDSTFYDEPWFTSLQGRMWTTDFNEIFRERRGYNPTLLYPALWMDIGGDTGFARDALLSMRADLYAEGFPKKIQEWATAHGISLTGHINQEEVCNPSGITDDLLKSFRYQDIPGIDQIFFPGRAEKVYKLVSSAAYNWDKELVMCECFGAINGLTERQMYMETMDQYAKGINLFVPHAVWYDVNNVVFQPELSWRDAYYGTFLKEFNLYCARLSMLLQEGGHVSRTAVLYPIASLHAEYRMNWSTNPDDYVLGGPSRPEDDYQQVGEALFYGANCDFTYLHPERLLEQATLADGVLTLTHTRHTQAYEVIVLPGQDTLSVQVLARLRDFVLAGGTVIATSTLPILSAEQGRDHQAVALVQEIFGRTKAPERPEKKNFPGGGAAWSLPHGDMEALCDIVTGLKPDVRLAEKHPGIGCIHKSRRQEDVYFFVNRSEAAADTLLTLKLPPSGPATLCDPHTGETTPYNLQRVGSDAVFRLSLAAEKSLFLVIQK